MGKFSALLRAMTSRFLHCSSRCLVHAPGGLSCLLSWKNEGLQVDKMLVLKNCTCWSDLLQSDDTGVCRDLLNNVYRLQCNVLICLARATYMNRDGLAEIIDYQEAIDGNLIIKHFIGNQLLVQLKKTNNGR